MTEKDMEAWKKELEIIQSPGQLGQATGTLQYRVIADNPLKYENIAQPIRLN